MSLNEVKQFTVTHLHASVLDFPEDTEAFFNHARLIYNTAIST